MEKPTTQERSLFHTLGNNVSVFEEQNLRNAERTEEEISVIEKKKVFLLVGICGLSNFMVFLSAFIVSSFYPKAAQHKGLSGIEIGWILGILHIVVLITAYADLKILQIVSLKKQLLIGLIGSGVSCGLFGLSYFIEDRTTFTVIQFVLRFIHGGCLAATDISAFILTNIKTPKKYLSTAMGVLEGFLSLALLLSAPLGSYLYQVGIYCTPFLVCGGACLIYALLTYFLIEETEYKDTIEVTYALKKTISCSMSYYLYGFLLYGSLLGLLATMLEPKLREFNLSLSEVGNVMMIPNAALVIAFPLWGQICDRSRKFAIVSAISFLLIIFSMVIFGPFPHTGMIFANFKVFIASIVICAVGMAALSVSSFSRCKINFLKSCSHEEAPAAGTLVSVAYIGFVNGGITIGNVLGGIVIDYLGYSYGAVVWCTLSIIGITFLLVSSLLEKKASENISRNYDDNSTKL